MTKNTYDIEYELKSQHSKKAVFNFLIIGTALIFFSKHGMNSIIGIAIFYMAGVYLASFLSIPSYIFKLWLARKITLDQVFKLKKYYWIFELIYSFGTTYLVFYLSSLIF